MISTASIIDDVNMNNSIQHTFDTNKNCLLNTVLITTPITEPQKYHDTSI